MEQEDPVDDPGNSAEPDFSVQTIRVRPSTSLEYVTFEPDALFPDQINFQFKFMPYARPHDIEKVIDMFELNTLTDRMTCSVTCDFCLRDKLVVYKRHYCDRCGGEFIDACEACQAREGFCIYDHVGCIPYVYLDPPNPPVEHDY